MLAKKFWGSHLWARGYFAAINLKPGTNDHLDHLAFLMKAVNLDPKPYLKIEIW